MNYKELSSFVRNSRDFLDVIVFYLSGSLSLSKTGNGLLRIKQQRIEQAKNIVICHLNINSIRNRFDTLDEIVKEFDIFLISE